MSHRAPRLAAGLILLGAALGAGRWLADFLALRWWALAISPEAGVAVTRRLLTGFALDLSGFLLALVWFGANARLIHLAARELGPDEQGGHPAAREALGHPQAWFWLAVGAFLLAVLLGTGTSSWTDALVLAGSGLRFGLAEPALGVDAGTLVSRLPLWLRLHSGAAFLVLPALGIAGAIHMLTGAVRLGRGRLAITGRARLHLGMLLAALALLLCASRLLAPLELAAGIPMPVVPGVAQLHRTVGLFVAGLALATAAVSALWAMRPVHSMVAGSWFVLSATLVGAEALLPSDRPDFRDPDAAAVLQRFEEAGYGLRVGAGGPRPVEHSLWDAAAAVRLAGLDSAERNRVVPGTLLGAPTPAGMWVAVTSEAGSQGLPVFAMHERRVLDDGRPVRRGAAAGGPDSAGSPWGTLPVAAVRPGAPMLEVGEDTGVLAGGVLRRLLLAWALQDGRPVVAPRTSRIAWHLTPEARLRTLAPWALWSGPRAVLSADGLRWVVDGYSASDVFPMTRRREFEGRPVSYVRAGFVGVIEPRSGRTTIYLRPEADSLSKAWARANRGLVRNATQLPEPIRQALGYPAALLAVQAELIGSGPVGNHRPDEALVPLNAEQPLPGMVAGEVLMPLVDVATTQVRALVGGFSRGGRDSLWLVALDSTGAMDGAEALARRWVRLPLVQGLRDSVLAAGGTVQAGRVRYALESGGLVAWQPLWAGATGRDLRLVAVATAKGDRFGAGRTLGAGWAALAGASAGRAGLSGPMAALDEARRWSIVADSALRQGDLAAFGRAFAALRAALQREDGTPP